jgi:hypothetical protein
MVVPRLYPPSWRELRPEEQKVQFAALEARIEAEAADFYEAARGLLLPIREAAKKQAASLRTRSWSELTKINIRPFFRRYATGLKERLNDVYQYARTEAAHEIGTAPPTVAAEYVEWMDVKSRITSQLHGNVLEAKIRSALLGRRPGEAPEAVVESVFDSFLGSEVRRGGTLWATLAIQAARRDVFFANRGRIYSYTWSAVLDRRVCEVCKFLDDITWRADDTTMFWPPIHWECRCLLVPTLVGEVYKPDISTILPEGYEPPGMVAFHKAVGVYQG